MPRYLALDAYGCCCGLGAQHTWVCVQYGCDARGFVCSTAAMHVGLHATRLQWTWVCVRHGRTACGSACDVDACVCEVSWCAAGAHVRQYVSWGVNDRCQWVGWRPLLFCGVYQHTTSAKRRRGASQNAAAAWAAAQYLTLCAVKNHRVVLLQGCPVKSHGGRCSHSTKGSCGRRCLHNLNLNIITHVGASAG